jgi:hypothetical protein
VKITLRSDVQSFARASLATERAAKEMEVAALEWDRAALKFQVGARCTSLMQTWIW